MKKILAEQGFEPNDAGWVRIAPPLKGILPPLNLSRAIVFFVKVGPPDRCQVGSFPDVGNVTCRNFSEKNYAIVVLFPLSQMRLFMIS